MTDERTDQTWPLTPEQLEELDRRWRAFEERPDEGESWEDFRSSLLNE
jgi:broad specificity phosphatase PhoE